MFTNEFEFDETIITVLDDSGVYEDVQIFMDENEVYIRQWNERQGKFDLVVASPKMLMEILEAMKLPEGAYYIDSKSQW